MAKPERPLRIAMLTHSTNPRGGVVHALELSEALQRAGHRVTVIAPALAGQRFFRDIACGVELAPVSPAAKNAGLVESVGLRIDAVASHLRALPGSREFDVFHSQDSITGNALADLVDDGTIAGYARTVHHLDSFIDERLAAWQRRAYERASQVFCVSQLWCDTLRIQYHIDATLVHNGVNLERYSATPSPADAGVASRYGLRPGAPIVLAVGGVEERKNTVRLLKAFALLQAGHPKAQLVVAGGASLLDHEAYGAAWDDALASTGLRTGPGSDVVLTGTVDDAAMPSLYRLADVFAMPSLREGFGLAALEALASGTPAVVSRLAPFTEFLSDEDVDWVDPLIPGSIADGIDMALKRKEVLPGSSASPLFKRFDWGASAARHTHLYRMHLLQTQPRPASR